jgi:hypothetical protein
MWHPCRYSDMRAAATPYPPGPTGRRTGIDGQADGDIGAAVILQHLGRVLVAGVDDDVRAERQACENERMRNTDGSILSIGSSGSILSIGSAGSILSIGSAGSILSIGSAGSIASVLSVGSAASIGSVLSALSSWSVLAWRGRPRGEAAA